jgi:hypothetical protein
LDRQVIDGLDVVQRISSAGGAPPFFKPLQEIKILGVRVVEQHEISGKVPPNGRFEAKKFVDGLGG